MGWFDEDYINLWPVMTACDQTGKRVAFSNILSAYTRPIATVDMMRYLPEATPGVMEYLFISMFLWARDQGINKFDLGLCALAGVGTETKDPAVDKAIHYLYEHMTRFFDFQGLHKFKEKFHPEWSPRNLAFPSYSNLPAVVLAMIRADSNRAPITRYFKK